MCTTHLSSTFSCLVALRGSNRYKWGRVLRIAHRPSCPLVSWRINRQWRLPPPKPLCMGPLQWLWRMCCWDLVDCTSHLSIPRVLMVLGRYYFSVFVHKQCQSESSPPPQLKLEVNGRWGCQPWCQLPAICLNQVWPEKPEHPYTTIGKPHTVHVTLLSVYHQQWPRAPATQQVASTLPSSSLWPPMTRYYKVPKVGAAGSREQQWRLSECWNT